MNYWYTFIFYRVSSLASLQDRFMLTGPEFECSRNVTSSLAFLAYERMFTSGNKTFHSFLKLKKEQRNSEDMSVALRANVFSLNAHKKVVYVRVADAVYTKNHRHSAKSTAVSFTARANKPKTPYILRCFGIGLNKRSGFVMVQRTSVCFIE